MFGVHQFMKLLPKFRCKLGSFIGHNLLGTPWRHIIRDMYNSVSIAPEYVILTGLK
jgi:hypothetical protein